jgi:hypothetical protein
MRCAAMMIVLACACESGPPSPPRECTPVSAGVNASEIFVDDVTYTPPAGCTPPAELGPITSEGEFRSAFACNVPSGVDFTQRHLYVVVVADGDQPVWTARETGVLHAGITAACGQNLAGVVFLTEVNESVRVHPCACEAP